MWEILSLGCVPYENIPFDQIGNYVQLGEFKLIPDWIQTKAYNETHIKFLR